jgi:hypothetical protein
MSISQNQYMEVVRKFQPLKIDYDNCFQKWSIFQGSRLGASSFVSPFFLKHLTIRPSSENTGLAPANPFQAH